MVQLLYTACLWSSPSSKHTSKTPATSALLPEPTASGSSSSAASTGLLTCGSTSNLYLASPPTTRPAYSLSPREWSCGSVLLSEHLR